MVSGWGGGQGGVVDVFEGWFWLPELVLSLVVVWQPVAANVAKANKTRTFFMVVRLLLLFSTPNCLQIQSQIWLIGILA
jgi:hypothetical protein